MSINSLKYREAPAGENDDDLIEKKLEEYNYSVAAPVAAEEEELCYKAVDENGDIIGGCILCIDRWKVADLDILWVDEKYRRKGLGSALIRKAESVFREKGCSLVVLGTFSFQARPLYEKHGYKLNGVIEDWPRGHCNYSMSKRLGESSPEYVPSKPAEEISYEIVEGSEEDSKYIIKNLVDYNTSKAPRAHEDISLSKIIAGEDGSFIAGCTADAGDWNDGFIDIFVEEPYRGQGIGSHLLAEFEREAREKGVYMVIIFAYDWQADFFLKRGYTVCSITEGGPEGHKSYNMSKKL